MSPVTKYFMALAVGATGLLAEPVSTALKVGTAIPDAVLHLETGDPVNLRKLVVGKPGVLIFFRGGWCPYCQAHLAGLAAIEPQLLAMGVQLFAISMDQPSVLRATPNREKIGYRLLSDNEAVAVKAFGIAYTVDEKTMAVLNSYHIDIEAASGRNHHVLPHPAVFVIGEDGTVRFVYAETDYKIRLAPEKVVEAAREAVRSVKKMM